MFSFLTSTSADRCMPPIWLAVLAWISLVSAFPCAVLVTVDVFVRGIGKPFGSWTSFGP